jgi:hypothetical protein
MPRTSSLGTQGCVGDVAVNWSGFNVGGNGGAINKEIVSTC